MSLDVLFCCGCSLALGRPWGRGCLSFPAYSPRPGSQSLALIPPFSEFCYRVPCVHTGLLSLGEAGGSSRQLGDRPCFLRKTRRRQRICWVFFPQFATRTCCLSFAFWKMLGLLGELWWGCLQGRTCPTMALVWSAAPGIARITESWNNLVWKGL